jgi:uncharacterized repeat protein (TIGR03803 family)
MNSLGGAYNYGNIFSIDTDLSPATFIDLFDFKNDSGTSPHGDLTLSGNILYGMTSAGGTHNEGVLFSFNYAEAGMNELKVESEKVKVEPNPNKGKFTVQIAYSHQLIANSQIQIYNVLGEKVFSQYSIPIAIGINTQYHIDISEQPSGVYYYRVLDENGELTGNGKIVIQK